MTINYVGMLSVVLLLGILIGWLRTRGIARRSYQDYLTRIARLSDMAGIKDYSKEEANKRLMEVAHLAYVALGVSKETDDPYNVMYIAIETEDSSS